MTLVVMIGGDRDGQLYDLPAGRVGVRFPTDADEPEDHYTRDRVRFPSGGVAEFLRHSTLGTFEATQIFLRQSAK